MNSSATKPVTSPLEKVATVAALVIMSGVLARIGSTSSATDSAGAVSTVAQATVCIGALLRLLAPSARVRGRLGADPWLIALFVVVVVSLSQSLDPALGLRRAAAAAMYTIFGLYLADRYSLREQLLMVSWAVAITAAASAVVVLGRPSFGRMPAGDSAWRGVFVQKNVLARAMALGCTAATYAFATARSTRQRVVVAALFAVPGVALISAHSSLAPLAVVVAALPLAVRTMSRLNRPARGAVVATTSAGIVTASIAVGAAGGLLAVIGKDPSLNGRTPLWSSVADAISAHPVLGYGYGTFWQGWHQPSTMVLLDNVWGPPNAHDGVLDMLLGVGVIGTVVWLVVVGRGFVVAAKASARAVDGSALWPLGFLLLLVTYNVLEVTTLSNALFWSLFVAVSTSCRQRLTPRVPDVQPFVRFALDGA